MTEKTTKLDIEALRDSFGLERKEPYKTILDILRDKPGSRIVDVAAAMEAKKWTTRSRLYRLAADGYVRVERVLNVPFFFANKRG
ncbi:MAG: hypothetical protein ACXV45_07320 [Halobacteriota archaeon]